MFHYLAAVLLFTQSFINSAINDRYKVNEVKVYKGDNGIKVVILELNKKDQYLIAVTNSASELDGKILPYELDNSLNKIRYKTTWHGKPAYFLHIQETFEGKRLILYTPGVISEGNRLLFDEAATKENSNDKNIADYLSEYNRQLSNGTISQFMNFNRQQEQNQISDEIQKLTKQLNIACGTIIVTEINWLSINDNYIQNSGVAKLCGYPLEIMTSLCGLTEIARNTIAQKVKIVKCEFAATTNLNIAANGVITWATNIKAPNAADYIHEQFYNIALTPQANVPKSDITLPWGNGKTLAERIALERTMVCTDKQAKHFLVVAPDTLRLYRLYYGDKQTIYRIPHPSNPNITGPLFFEPRNYSNQQSTNFNDTDLRAYSSVLIDTKKKICAVQCDIRRTDLEVLSANQAAQLLYSATFKPPLHNRRPHALTRDDRGTYYYVDRGYTLATQKNYRLYIGPKGNLKLQHMINVVSDSRGEIFSTRNGSLRLVLGPDGFESVWISGNKRTNLTAVPIAENYALIYNELGIYVSERLGTPCDDF
ncbi:MAG: hypothetical protein JW841_02890 [Deltaproteobacteria bacterium]|nr:hypothetical protein [Deltaproteobacteria bacterium]